MVAAMPLQIDARPNEKTVTLRDLRRVAFGLSAAILIVMLAGAISDDSGSDSVSAELDNLVTKSYVNIGVTTAAGDNVVTAAEASSGFTVTGTSNGADGGTVSAHYGSVSTTCVAANPGGTWSCDFDDDGSGDANSDGTDNADMNGVADGTITIYATVTVGGTAYTSSNFFVTQDTVVPTMTITSTTSGVTSGSTTNDASIALKFTSSESTTDLVSGDITVSGGSISNFAGSGAVYTATFTPSGDATYTISVGQGSYNDANSNPNAASNNFQWAYDGTPPTMTITTTTAGVSSGSTTNDATIAYVFTSNEPTTNFDINDITVSGGSMGSFNADSSTVYTATFTPSGDVATSVSVAAGTFTDSGGTDNTVSNTFAWTYDGTAPTMTITAAVSGSPLNTGSTTNDATITLTFTSSEAMTGFVVGDIDITSGSLSALSGSGTTYTSTFTPSGDVTHTIDIDASQFTDAVGNQNTASNAYTWTYDGTDPTMTITSSGSANGGASNAAVTLTFTSSEATTNFVKDDITVSGGTLGALSGSGTTYTALFTPSAEGSMTIDVAANKFTDAVGNGNTAATQFAYTHDTTAPAMVITTTSGITTGDTSNDATIAYVFTAGQATTNFDSSDIDVTGGTITAFAADGGSTTVYLATFTPSGQGATSVAVAAGAFTDAAGNANTVSNTFAWTFDSVGPTMTITSSGSANGGASNAAVTLTFTSNEPTANFDVTDILVTNGALSSFAAGSTTVYTATFTPTGEGAVTIDVAVNKFTDASGNQNTAATQFAYTHDTTAPAMVITTTSGITTGDTSNDATIAYVFTAGQATTNFDSSDIDVTGGTITAFAADGGSTTVYLATFTPSGQGATSVAVAAGAFTDAAGNANTVSNTFAWTFDSVGPTMTITSSGSANGGAFNAATTLTFTSNEPTANFIVTDILVTNGALSAFNAGSTTVYTATFTPTGEGAVTIDVAANKFTDASGNQNTAATQFAYTHDTTAPAMVITTTSGITSGDTSNDATIAYVFTAGQATTNFVKSDITVSGGTLGTLSGSGTTYTATFTPSGDGATSVAVAAGTFTDAAGNDNTVSNTFAWTYDGTAPAMVITTTTAGVTSGSTTNDATIAYVFTAGQATTNFDSSDIDVTGGTITAFAADGGSTTVYLATFTPSGQGATSVAVAAGAFTDAVGNANTVSNTFAWTFDSVGPTMTITSSTVDSGDTSKDATIALTFTSNAATTDLILGDITLSSGSLSALSGSGTTYTATFTPSGDVTHTISIAVNKFTDAAGNQNSASNNFLWTYDSTAPTVAITTVATDGYVNAAEEGSFTITGTSVGAVGQDVTVTYGGVSDADTITVDANGDWTMTMCDDAGEDCSGIAEGLVTVTAAVSDASGNAATPASLNVFLDTTSPTTVVSTVVSITTDSGTNGDFITNDASSTVAATLNQALATGETLEVSVNGGSSYADVPGGHVSGTAVSTTVTLAAGSNNIVFRVSDAASNYGNTLTRAYTLDTTAPTISSIAVTGVTSGQFGNSASYTVVVTASEALAAAPTLTLATGSVGSGAGSVSDTVWTYTLTSTAGASVAHTIKVAAGGASDVAGTVTTGDSATFSWTQDTVLATPTVVSMSTSDNTPSITGTFDDGDYTAFTVVVNSVTYTAGADAELVVSDDGSDAWTLTTPALSDNTYQVVATATDRAGNSKADTSTGELEVDTTAPTLTTLTVLSNNGVTTSNAKTGDLITITMVFSEPINSGSLVVVLDDGDTAGDMTENCSSTTECTATMTLAGTVANGALDFDINVNDDTTTNPNALVERTEQHITSGTTITVDNTKPTLTIAMASDNSNTAYAKSGDEITLTITASESLSTGPTCTIATESATVTGSGTSWSATLTVASGMTQGAAAISCSAFVDQTGNIGVTDTDANTGISYNRLHCSDSNF